ncbi:MAG: hypothetical protein HZB15_14450 [Actinobacteria bacterium]|nr:hypothetical protein [Actinomycetota bacterium]
MIVVVDAPNGVGAAASVVAGSIVGTGSGSSLTDTLGGKPVALDPDHTSAPTAPTTSTAAAGNSQLNGRSLVGRKD